MLSLWLVRRKAVDLNSAGLLIQVRLRTRDSAWVLLAFPRVEAVLSVACTWCAPSTGACPCLGEWAVRTVRWVILLERRYLPDTAKSHTRVVCWAGPQSVLSITGSPLCGAGWGRAQRRVQAQKWRWASRP